MRRVIYKLNFTEEEQQQISDIFSNQKYKNVYFILKLILLLLSLLLPTLYSFWVRQESFLSSQALKMVQSSHIFFYQSVWLSHFLAFFLIIPFFGLLLLHIFAGFCSKFTIYTTLSSFWLSLCNPKRLTSNSNYLSSNLKEKIWYLERKILAKNGIALALSVLLLTVLIFFDTHNYSILNERGWYYKGYASFRKFTQPWSAIKSILISCDYEPRGIKGEIGISRQWQYVLNFTDNESLNLLNYSTLHPISHQLNKVSELAEQLNIPFEVKIYGLCSIPGALKACEAQLQELYPSQYEKMKEILMERNTNLSQCPLSH